MPAYEYVCDRCQKAFLAVMSVKEHDEHTVRCPACGATQVRQLLTSFIARTSKKS